MFNRHERNLLLKSRINPSQVKLKIYSQAGIAIIISNMVFFLHHYFRCFFV